MIVDGEEPGVGDCRTMRVVGKIGENERRSAEGRRGADDPIGLAQRYDAFGEGAPFGEQREVAEKAQRADNLIERRPGNALREDAPGRRARPPTPTGPGNDRNMTEP